MGNTLTIDEVNQKLSALRDQKINVDAKLTVLQEDNRPSDSKKLESLIEEKGNIDTEIYELRKIREKIIPSPIDKNKISRNPETLDTIAKELEILRSQQSKLNTMKLKIDAEIRIFEAKYRKALRNKKTDEFFTDRKKSVFEKNNISTIEELFDIPKKDTFKRIFLNDIVDVHDVKTYQSCLDYAEIHGKIDIIANVIPESFSIMIRNGFVDMIAITNLFIRNNDIRIQDQNDYQHKLKSKFPRCHRSCGCDFDEIDFSLDAKEKEFIEPPRFISLFDDHSLYEQKMSIFERIYTAK